MVSIDLRSLIGRLDEVCRRALEAAAGLALSRTHYNIEIEHLLTALLESGETDLSVILDYYEIDYGRFTADLNRALDRMKTGNGRAPALAPELADLCKQAWLFASLEQGAARLRSGHLLWALLADETLARRARDTSAQLPRISADLLKRDFAAVTARSPEAATAAGAAPAGQPGGGPALERFTTDLTARARAGRLGPILGRDSEIRQAIDILGRRRQNNPILTGEAGVGKTAVVEGLALRIAAGDVPPALASVVLRTLDPGLLQAGAGVKGEVESRLKSVIEEVKASPVPVILVIDAAHTLVGAGNLLEPALARGELRAIAITGWAEYRKYVEKDAALSRHFQVVKIEEPAEPAALAMIRGLAATLEAHHGVQILDEALVEAVRLSARYIPARQLPDKAVSLIDTACARVAMSQAAIPAPVEDHRRRVAVIDTELSILAREAAAGAEHAERLEALATERANTEADLAELEARWEIEQGLVTTLRDLRAAIEAAPDAIASDIDGQAGLRSRLIATTAELRAVQGDQPLIFPVVDAPAVAAIVQAWTGIPAGRMQGDDIRTVLDLRETLGHRIIGQPQALAAVAQALRTSRARLTDPHKPAGVFLMVGAAGTGKTETALALADQLYGGEQNLTVLTMSASTEEHQLGLLTEAVRRRPYSVILLDEMEKAPPGVQDIFSRLFDKGVLQDGEGREIDFRNTVIIMTSNAGSERIAGLSADPETAPDAAGLAEALRPELATYFKPAFLAQVTLVPYFPLPEAIIRQIVVLQLGRLRARLRSAWRAAFDWEPALVEQIAARCTETSSGARNVEGILSRTLLPELSAEVLARLAEGQAVRRIEVAVGAGGGFVYTLA